MIGEVEPYNHLTSFFLQIRVIVEGYFIKLSSIFQDTALFMTFVGDVLILSCSMYIKSPCFFQENKFTIPKAIQGDHIRLPKAYITVWHYASCPFHMHQKHYIICMSL
jgi:hypothetical protein